MLADVCEADAGVDLAFRSRVCSVRMTGHVSATVRRTLPRKWVDLAPAV